ncbi:hypothetical protein QBC45DRAFT_420548 [Copromyces sp. CBS 386.78]|nr:hypothetical protein QBC45DRAFT_420548 [Copromyces sp. CBS 386.78]
MTPRPLPALLILLSVYPYISMFLQLWKFSFVLSGVRPAMLKPCRAIDAVNTFAIHMYMPGKTLRKMTSSVNHIAVFCTGP